MSLSVEKILSSDRLPSLPEVALKVVQIARQPDPDFTELVESIRLDPAIAGRILKTANSALLGMKTRASSIETAVPRLGTTMVRALVLGFTLADAHKSRSPVLRAWYQQIWRESLIQAAAAEVLAERQGGRVDPGTWFLAGLLQDIGRLALLTTCQEEYVDNVLELEDDRAQIDREISYYGFSHVDVSVALCQRWNLDDDIVDAIRVHHRVAHRVVPLRFVSSTSLAAGLITASYFADYLEEVSRNLSCSREQIERMLMQVFALRPNDVFRVLADVDARVGEVAATFNVDIGNTPSLEAILADAQEVLSRIAVAGQLRLVNACVDFEDEVAASRIEAEKKAASSEPVKCWHDPATRTFNRTYLDQALTATISQSHEQNVPLGLILVEASEGGNDGIDDNGEKSRLRRVADILRQSVRLSDAVVRFGQNEFLISMYDVNVDMLPLLTDQIQRRMARDLASEHKNTSPCAFAALYYDPSMTKPESSGSLIEKLRKIGTTSGRLSVACVNQGCVVPSESRLTSELLVQ
ncbi:MAG: HDOD domain-containing protein [Planctomycetaceae bacterium]|nr:HDOD domain-containing protein [Planctomycetaceae bacterium]